MAGLKEVRTRIASVVSTRQITSAMKMVSASKLRRAQTAIQKLRPYAAKMNEILASLRSSIEDTGESAYFKQREVKKVLLVVVTSNRGLCGGFNANVIKKVSQMLREEYAPQHATGNVSLICIGKKAADFFIRRKFPVIANHHEVFDALTYENTIPITESLMNDFAQGRYDRIEIIYNQFKNAAVQKLISEQFLPVSESAHKKSQEQIDYIFEPGKTEIVSELVPRSLKVQFYKALLDSFASEHGARMTAMHKATDNAEDILRELRLSYNKARQATITKEILEIISGANALKN